MQIIIKETDKRENFYPFSLLHSICEIRCGALRLIDKIKLLFPDSNIVFIGDELISNSLIKRENLTSNILYDVPTLVIYSNLILDKATLTPMSNFIEENFSDSTFTDASDNIIGCYFAALTEKNMKDFNLAKYPLTAKQIKVAKFISYF
jgi:hypothetical protein